jgi:peptidoglycan hydrolase-like protein with peptidoglycan-binding domain
VRRLQRALARLGYPPGKIDGQYGSATTQALANFQRANKLTADGILGPATLAALTRSLRNRS